MFTSNYEGTKLWKLLIKTESGIEYLLKTEIKLWGEKILDFSVGKILGL